MFKDFMKELDLDENYFNPIGIICYAFSFVIQETQFKELISLKKQPLQ